MQQLNITMTYRDICVYVAGPLTSSGYAGDNVRAALFAAEALASKGYWPYVPHLTHFWHMIFPHQEGHTSFWMRLDHVFLKRCQAVLRLPGDSTGADMEVSWANALDIPVFTPEDLVFGTMDKAIYDRYGVKLGHLREIGA